jgi:cyclase
MKINKSLSLVSCAALFAAAAAAAQPVVKDNGGRMERLADGVYAILHDDATDEWPHSNTGVVIGKDTVLVLDSCYLPSRAAADIALIRQVTQKPVKYLVITHWHMDHNNGTAAYRDAFPGIEVVAQRDTARFIDINSRYWSRFSTAEGSSRRVSLAELEAAAASGKDAKQAAFAAQRRGELDEFVHLRVVRPEHVFDHELTLDLGGRVALIKDWGPANSPHDATLYLPAEKILFTGDIVVQSPLPYTGGAWPLPWIEVLRALEAIPLSALVPGHGPVMRDHSYVRQVRALLEAVVTRVEASIREGRPLDWIQKNVSFDDLRTGPWAERSAQIDEDWAYTITTIVERAWKGIRGQG